MDILVMAGQVILALAILVTIHEFGHYIAARAFGIRVEKFYLFFDVGGVKLFSFRKGDTEYGVGWLPLGGYVKITGMIDESMDKSFKETPPQPHEFRSKPAWQRLIVMLGGIIMNVLLGILIFSLHTLYYGEEYLPKEELRHGIVAYSTGQMVGFQTGDRIVKINGQDLEKADEIVSPDLILESDVVYTVERNGKILDIPIEDNYIAPILDSGLSNFIALRLPFAVGELSEESAKKAGLKHGDSIIALNNIPTPYFHNLAESLAKLKDKDVVLTVKRGNEIKTLHAHISKEGTIGFKPLFAYQTEKFSVGKSFAIGTSKAWHAVSDNVKGLGRVISGHIPAKKSVSSFIGIGKAFGGKWRWQSFWYLTAMLSMILAFMNLLPIPALDGGHVLFLLVEMVRRKPLSYRFLEVAQMVGMVLIFLLMGFALYNDFANFIFK